MHFLPDKIIVNRQSFGYRNKQIALLPTLSISTPRWLISLVSLKVTVTEKLYPVDTSRTYATDSKSMALDDEKC